MPDLPAVPAWLAFSTVLGWVSLAALAFAPIGAWPDSGLRGNIERAMLFFIVAALTRATITDHRTRLQILALAVFAALFEVCRAWIAGQSNGGTGWASSTAGVMVGAILLRKIAHAYSWHWGW